MRNKQQKGFTLIELLVVIAIIGLLASVVLLSLNSARQKSRDAKRLADVRQIASALELYFNDCGSYPVVTANLTLNNGQTLSEGTGTNCGANTRATAADGGIAATTSGTVLLGQFPTAPTPADGTCGAANSYIYRSYEDGGNTDPNDAGDTSAVSYAVTFCMGAATGGYTDGADAGSDVNGTLTPSGITAL